MIVALAGGVGGAKLADGLYRTVPLDSLAVIVNTGDDFELYGLRIAPDVDTVMYTLAGVANPATGWGIAGDTFATLDMLRRYGDDAWFQLGDRDIATHLRRTQLLREGWSATRMTAKLAGALGIRAAILPMCDEPVATRVTTPDGELEFQEYFVRRRHQDPVRSVRFAGIERAAPTPRVRAALAQAEAIIFCPSNPVVSIGPILSVPGMRTLVEQSRAPRVAVSPIIADRALKGPADRMLGDLGDEVSAYGVARRYQGLVDGIVLDEADRELVDRIEALGMRVLVTSTVMRDADDRGRLAADVLAFARALATERGTA